MLRAVSALLLKFSLPPTSKYYILYTTSLMTAMPVCTCTRVQYGGPHVEWIFGPTTRPAYFTFLSGRRSFRPPSGHHIHLTIRTLELTSVTYRVGRSSGEINVQKISPNNPTDASVSGRIGWSRPRAENSLASGELRGRSFGLKGRFWTQFYTRWAPNWTACVLCFY